VLRQENPGSDDQRQSHGEAGDKADQGLSRRLRYSLQFAVMLKGGCEGTVLPIYYRD
jgi:hypothetical protein